MANKNIQMNQKNVNSWDKLYPLTLIDNVYDTDGVTSLRVVTDKSGIINVKTPPAGYVSAKGDGVTDDTNAIKALLAAFDSIHIPTGTYVISDTLDFMNKSIHGENMMSTIIKMTATDNTKPILKTGRTSLIENLLLRFVSVTGSEQRGQKVCVWCTNSTGVELERGSTVRNIRCDTCGTGFYDGGDGVFSTIFESIEITGFTFAGFDFPTNGRTGNIYDNIYISNIDNTVSAGPYYTPAYGFFISGESPCNIRELNIEHCKCYQPLYLQNINGLVCESVHLEGISVMTPYNGFVKLDSVSGVIDHIDFVYTRHDVASTFLFKLESCENSNPVGDNKTTKHEAHIIINNINCTGLNYPDWQIFPTYPNKSLLNATGFCFFFRDWQNYDTANYFVTLNNYFWQSFLTTNDDSSIYENFLADPNGKITFLCMGQLIKSGTTAQRPTKRLCKNVTTYYDIDVLALLIWNGTVWVKANQPDIKSYSVPSSGNYSIVGIGLATSTTTAFINVPLPDNFSAAPNTLNVTASEWNLSDGVTNTACTAITLISSDTTKRTARIQCTVAAGLTQFRPYTLNGNGTPNKVMTFTTP